MSPLESAARRRKENAAAERREARRSAIRPVISGDPEMGPLARRTIGCGASAPAPVGALLPLIFSGSGKQTRGTRSPARNRRRSVGFRACRAHDNPTPRALHLLFVQKIR